FTTGILTQISSIRLHPPLSPKNTRKPSSEKSLEDLSRHGSYFYKAAAEHRMAQERALDRILMHLSKDFHLASKPLTYMATRYLHSLKEDLFLW
ncbi:MAG TPA: hypothetical protein VMX75_05245, partial [Spirochaetia bacterium]|nr:hypothetical protein [Spirochaetia bacterium]